MSAIRPPFLLESICQLQLLSGYATEEAGIADHRVTDGVTRTSLRATPDDTSLRVDRIAYTAGAHTHWHVHLGEQVIYGERGRGWVRFADRPRHVVEPGDVVVVPVGVRHWHGATPDDAFVHLTVTAGGDTVWIAEVTPDEYAGGSRP